MTFGSLAPLVFFPFWFFLFRETGLFSSGFHLVDEHVIVEMVADLAAPDASLAEVMRKWVAIDMGEGRFRPLYYASRVLRAEFFGLRWQDWITWNAVAAASAGAALFVFGRLLGLTGLLSLALAAMSTLGRPATVWWRLGTPETEGNLLVALALMLMTLALVTRRHRAGCERLAFVLAVLASLTKEGMIIYLPAIAAMRALLPCWLYGTPLRSAVSEAPLFITALGLVAVVELTVLTLAVGTAGTGYAGLDAASFDPSRLWASIKAVNRVTGLRLAAAASVGLLGMSLIHLRTDGRALRRRLLMIWLVFLIAALPQVLLYSKSGWADHYFNPLVISGALLLMLSVDSLRPIQRWLYLVFVLLVLFQINDRFKWTVRHAREYAADGTALQGLLAAAESCVPSHAPLLLVANPRVHYEEAFSLRTFLMMKEAGGQVHLATVGSAGSQIVSDALADKEQSRAFLSAQTLEQYYFLGQTLPRMHQTWNGPPAAILVLSPESLLDAFLRGTSAWLRPERYHHTDYEISGIRMRLMCLD